jgi:hypothetical protein
VRQNAPDPRIDPVDNPGRARRELVSIHRAGTAVLELLSMPLPTVDGRARRRKEPFDP